jgi:hypothetical protein
MFEVSRKGIFLEDTGKHAIAQTTYLNELVNYIDS